MYRILIVEDEQAIARAVAEELRHWGLESRCVENFRDVMAEFQAFQPQLVLLDIMLPFFNGYHWCNEIRKCSNAPIIFLSSASDNMNIVMAMNMGGDDFIAKPFDRTVQPVWGPLRAPPVRRAAHRQTCPQGSGTAG